MTLNADILHFLIYPFTLRVAIYKAGLKILGIFYTQKHFQGNISKINVDQKPYNSPSGFFLTFILTYESSRKYFLYELYV